MSVDVNDLLMKTKQDIFKQYLEVPAEYGYTPGISHVKNYKYDTFDAELYIQNNGPGTVQKVLITLPKNIHGKLPAVVVPFYFPEAMVGFDLETSAEETRFSQIAMSRFFAERGLITITAEAYHLTYDPEDKAPRNDFDRWLRSGTALLQKYPQWCGCGKLVADTQLLIDVLEKDERVDARCIGIAGHSLGGKMAFYTGCMDPRIKAILASDFGMNWEQSNWNEPWYWGDKLEKLIAAEVDHSQLLAMGGGKPFMLIAGHYDNMSSFDTMMRSQVYEAGSEDLVILNHATGHRPPPEALAAGMDFLVNKLEKQAFEQ